ncbi:MAG TPA: hypothetical protein VFM46_13720, partial [Pseudomonadales bacterium]|nr:hypothetical protein [Pseudomonadales bacterium]
AAVGAQTAGATSSAAGNTAETTAAAGAKVAEVKAETKPAENKKAVAAASVAAAGAVAKTSSDKAKAPPAKVAAKESKTASNVSKAAIGVAAAAGTGATMAASKTGVAATSAGAALSAAAPQQSDHFKQTLEQEKHTPPALPAAVTATARASANAPQLADNEFKVKRSESWWQKRVALFSDELQLNISNGQYKARVTLKNFKGPGTYKLGAGDVVVYQNEKEAYRSTAEKPGKVVISQLDNELLQGSLDVSTQSAQGSQSFDLKVNDMKVDSQAAEY